MICKILGSGTSSGVPTIGCKCSVCCSPDPKNQRLRASCWIQVDQQNIIIDTSPDFRQQALREKIPDVDAVLYTHPHSDHLLGIDDIRAYNFKTKGKVIPVYGNEWTKRDLFTRFSYAFKDGVSEGGGVPNLKFHQIQEDDRPFQIGKTEILPVSLPHGSASVLGFRIGGFAYVVDCHEVPDSAINKLKSLDILVLDCVRLKPHRTHLCLDDALRIAEKLQPKTTYLTHLSHDFDYQDEKTLLPKNVFFAYDGLSFEC